MAFAAFLALRTMKLSNSQLWSPHTFHLLKRVDWAGFSMTRWLLTVFPILLTHHPPREREVSKYTVYTAESHAKIGKYALENGNKRAQIHFKSQFPDLKESTIRNFKKTTRSNWKWQLKLQHFQLCLEVYRPPLLLELDRKLLQFLNAVRARGGVINSHVVRATADAIIRSNNSPAL